MMCTYRPVFSSGVCGEGECIWMDKAINVSQCDMSLSPYSNTYLYCSCSIH